MTDVARIVVSTGRGASLGDIARRTGVIGGVPVARTDSDQQVIDKQVARSQAWSEGTLPAGAGTKSAREHADDASLSASAAAGFVGGVMYASPGAGIAAVADGAFFSVGGDGVNTYALLYRKMGGAAVLQASYVSKAAYEGPGGAELIGHGPNGTAAPVSVDVQLKRHGGWPTAQAELQAYADNLVDTGSTATINLHAGLVIPVTGQGVTLDQSFHRVLDHGAVLDGSVGMANEAAILTITGSSGSPYNQALNIHRFPEIRGPGLASAVDGLLFDRQPATGGGNGPCHIRALAVVHDCRNGVIFRNRAYLNDIDGSIYACATGVWQDDSEDGQENNRVRATIFNCARAAYVSSVKADLQLDQRSLDSNGTLARVDVGSITFNGLHVEQAGTVTTFTSTPIILGGPFARVHWRGGSRRIPESARPFPYWVDGEGTFVDEVFEAINDISGSGAFAGPNVTLLRPGFIAGNETRDNCYVARAGRGRVPDPTFATLAGNCLSVTQSDPSGAIFAVQDRYTETHVPSGTHTSVLDVAGGKLIHTKAFGNSSSAGFQLVLRAAGQELIGGQIAYETDGVSYGYLPLTLAYGWLDPVPASSGRPNVLGLTGVATAGINLPASAVPTTIFPFGPMSSWRFPDWANVAVLVVDRTYMTAGAVSFSFPGGSNFDKVG